MSHEIFISYSRKDLNKVKAIKNEIERITGTGCWMDLNAIESGAEQFTKNIVQGINDCRIFLFMLSNHSQLSHFATRELNFALDKARQASNKHVVIVNIDNCSMSDEFLFLYGLRDAIMWDNQPQKEKLLKDIKNWLLNREGEIVDDFFETFFTVALENPDKPLYNSLDRIIEGYGI